MIDGPFITPHAVRQFQSRICRHRLDYDAARTAILSELREHGGVLKPLHSGRGFYVRTRGGCYSFRAVVVPAPNEGQHPVVVTILRSGT